jgi:hypothetical protein
LYYFNGGKGIKDLLARTGEPIIPSVAKYLAKAQAVDVHELAKLYQ